MNSSRCDYDSASVIYPWSTYIIRRRVQFYNQDISLRVWFFLTLFSSPSDKSRDCIILFTDGGANKGETNPEELVKKYWQLEKSLNKKSCVPLSALTIGNYFPHLLIEVYSIQRTVSYPGLDLDLFCLNTSNWLSVTEISWIKQLEIL